MTADGQPSAVLFRKRRVLEMTYLEALEHIHSLGKFGSKPGLERISQMLELMGNPHKKLKCIHVAGTNGKGSTCTFLASVLKEHGLKVGLYTSPFVTEFNERIRVDGKNISDTDLASYTELTYKKSLLSFDDEHPITEFEFITALAFKYFYDSGCDVVVLEVGLGGRLDATNVIEAPLASIIAKIDLDHTGILGDTVEKIAMEKCGIIKKGCPVVTTTENIGSVVDVIAAVAAEKDSELFFNKGFVPEIISSDIFGTSFIYNGERFELKMSGRHQVDNALTALKTVRLLFPKITYDEIYRGFKKAEIAARCELISENPLLLLDGSHNPNGTEALDKMLDTAEVNDAAAVIGFMADKDVSNALKKVLHRFSDIFTVSVESNKRSMRADELAELCKRLGANAIDTAGYSEAIEMALGTKKPVVVFGSLYLAGDIRPLLLKASKTDKTLP